MIIYSSELVMNKFDQKCLTYEQARGLEHDLIIRYGTLNRSNPLNNQINGIRWNNPNIEDYLKAAETLLYEETYVGGNYEE